MQTTINTFLPRTPTNFPYGKNGFFRTPKKLDYGMTHTEKRRKLWDGTYYDLKWIVSFKKRVGTVRKLGNRTFFYSLLDIIL